MYTGVRLNILAGPTLPLPLPAIIADRLESAEVARREGVSAAQLRFQLGRQAILDQIEFAQFKSGLLQTGFRISLVVLINSRPATIFDGVITHWEHAPSNDPGQSTLTITAEDLSILMDREERTLEHPAQDESVIALKILGQYAPFGVSPIVIPPAIVDPPLPLDRVPVQARTTDLRYLRQMAGRFGHVFYLIPGPFPGASQAYWGPPVRSGPPQRALSVDMGSFTNVTEIRFNNNATRPTYVSGLIQDRHTNAPMPVITPGALRPPLSALPSLYANFLLAQKKAPAVDGGLNFMQAQARAQGVTDRSTDRAVTATGELDVSRYGAPLEPHALVGLRGVGYLHDGMWYVAGVTHRLERGRYTQGFELAREGLGSLAPTAGI